MRNTSGAATVVGALVGASEVGAIVVSGADTSTGTAVDTASASSDPPPPHDESVATRIAANIDFEPVRMKANVGDVVRATRTTSMDRTTRLVPPLLVGVGAGILSGLFGVGGGILVVPALTMVLKLDQRMASGTSLGAVFPISVASLATYWSQDNVDWAMALWLAIGAVAGAVYGTKLIHRLPRRTIGYLFTAMLILTAIRLYVPTEADGRGAIEVGSAIALVIIGFLTGVLAGLLGIGGGVVMVPIMIVFFSAIPVIAKGTSAAVIIPTAIIGTWRNARAKNIDGRTAAIVGLAGIPTAIIGGLVADVMNEDLSNALFATLVLTVATKMLVDLRRESNA